MNLPKPGPGGDLRVWVLIAIGAARHLLPWLEKELRRRWELRTKKENNP